MSNVACPHPRNLHAVWPTRCLDCARAQLSKKTHLTHVVHNEGRYIQHTQSGTSPVSRLQRYRTLVNDLNLISQRGWPIGTYQNFPDSARKCASGTHHSSSTSSLVPPSSVIENTTYGTSQKHETVTPS